MFSCGYTIGPTNCGPQRILCFANLVDTPRIYAKNICGGTLLDSLELRWNRNLNAVKRPPGPQGERISPSVTVGTNWQEKNRFLKIESNNNNNNNNIDWVPTAAVNDFRAPASSWIAIFFLYIFFWSKKILKKRQKVFESTETPV